jgi:hypothetical protein
VAASRVAGQGWGGKGLTRGPATGLIDSKVFQTISNPNQTH